MNYTLIEHNSHCFNHAKTHSKYIYSNIKSNITLVIFSKITINIDKTKILKIIDIMKILLLKTLLIFTFLLL